MTNYRKSKISSTVWAALNTISFPTPHGVVHCGIVCRSEGGTVCNMWSYQEVGGMCLMARVSMVGYGGDWVIGGNMIAWKDQPQVAG